MVDASDNGSEGNDQRQCRCRKRCQSSFGVLARVVRAMNQNVGKETAHSDKECRRPAVRKVTGMPCPRYSHQWKYSEQSLSDAMRK